MPADKCDRRSEPTNCGVSEKASEPSYRDPPENWANHAANDPLRQSPKEGKRRRAEQQERRSNRHEQKVLHHVRRKQDIVKR